MYFRDLVEPSKEWLKYEVLISDLARFIEDCARYLMDAFDVAQVASAQSKCYSHATVLLLSRHVIESIDGVSVLAERGCAENCGPLLRSAFEAHLGVMYILEADSVRRGLAYQVAHAHRRIKLYRRCDPNDPIGRQIRAELNADPLLCVIDTIPGNLQAMVANLEKLFTKPEFAPIEQEWKAKRGGKDPEWFSLFSGPHDTRSLAIHLKLGAIYEFLYRSWSDVIHAGSGLNHIGASDQPGAVVLRPIRHPDGLETACTLAAQFCFSTARALVEKYDPAQKERFRQTYLEQLGSRFRQVSKGKLITAPWR